MVNQLKIADVQASPRDSHELVSLVGAASQIFSRVELAFLELSDLLNVIHGMSEDGSPTHCLAAIGKRIAEERAGNFEDQWAIYSVEVERHV